MQREYKEKNLEEINQFLSALWCTTLELWSLLTPSRVLIVCGHYQVFSSSGQFIYPTSVAKQSRKSEVNFLTLKISVWESGPSCADTLQVQPYWSALLCHSSVTQSTHSRSQPCHSLFLRKVYICPVWWSIPSHLVALWLTAFAIDIVVYMWLGKTVKLPLAHGSRLEGLASMSLVAQSWT